MPPPRAATRQEIQKFGHIATFLRKEMKRRGMGSTMELIEAIGLGKKNVAPYLWVNAKGAPSQENRTKLVAYFQVPEETFMARDPEAASGNGADHSSPAHSPAPPKTYQTLSVQFDGPEARIKLDIVLPNRKAWELLRLLQGAGITGNSDE